MAIRPRKMASPQAKCQQNKDDKFRLTKLPYSSSLTVQLYSPQLQVISTLSKIVWFLNFSSAFDAFFRRSVQHLFFKASDRLWVTEWLQSLDMWNIPTNPTVIHYDILNEEYKVMSAEWSTLLIWCGVSDLWGSLRMCYTNRYQLGNRMGSIECTLEYLFFTAVFHYFSLVS